MNTIKQNEYSVLTFFVSRCFFAGVAIHNITYIAKQDSWISVIIAFLAGLIPFALFYALLNFDPSLNIVKLTKKYCGKFFGTIINLIFICSLTFHASIVLWNLSNFINSQFLFKTPILVISIFFMLPVVYTVSKGFKTIGRTSLILFLMTIIIYIITALSLFSKINLSNLFPMFENGFMPVLDGALVSFSYSAIAIYPLLIIPKNDIKENNKLGKSLLKFYLINFISMFIVVFFIITIFGSPLTNLYQYPEFHILKTVNVANFFQRVESILAFQWLFDFAVGLMVFIYYLKTAIQQTFNFENKGNNILILIISAIVIFLSTIIFKNNTIAYDFLGKIYKYVRVVILVFIPFIVYIVALIRKNKV